MSYMFKTCKMLAALALAPLSLLTPGTALSQTNAAATAAQFADLPQAMLVMDFSGSMWGSVNGEAKFQVLNDIVDRNFDDWSQSLELGLLAYGHRRKGDCRDIELAFRPGEVQSRTLRNWVNNQRPVGKTPLGNSLVTAASYFNNKGQEANLIVLSDGIESCGVDPCRIVRDLQANGAKMTAHVIGFDLNARDAGEIRCIADLTGGTYVDANRADQLIDGFRRAVEIIAVKDDGAEQALRDTLDKSLDALRDTSQQLEAANNRAANAADNLAEANAEIRRLTALLDERDATIDQLQAGLEDCNDELARLAALLDDARDTIDIQNDALRDAAAENQQLANENQQLADDNQQLSNQNQQLNSNLADARDVIAGLEDQNEQQSRQIALLEDTLGERDSVILLLNEELAAKDEQIGGLNREIDGLNRDLEDANDTILLLNEKNEDLQAMLDEALRNRQLTVSSLDFGAFEGTTEPVDIAALVAERDSYLAALQTLRQNLGFVLDPLSQAQSIANAIPEEANPVAVPDELNEVIILLAPGVEGELPDLQWTLRGTSENAIGVRDAGSGARIPLPSFQGGYEIGLQLPGYEATLTVNSDPGAPVSRRTDLSLGRLSLSMPGSKAGVFFTTVNNAEGETVAKRPIETSGSMYLRPGLYTVRAQSEADVDEFEVQIYAGKETAVPLRF